MARLVLHLERHQDMETHVLIAREMRFSEVASVFLRSLRESDVQTLLEIRIDPEIQRNLLAPSYSASILEARKWLVRASAGVDRYFWVIDSCGIAVGYLQAHGSSSRPNLLKFGIAIAPAYQNMGFGQTAIKILMEKMPENYEGLLLDVAVDNLRAQSVYEKIGFVEVGRSVITFFEGMSSVVEMACVSSNGSAARSN